tara:strand:- start:8 stop:418 length:411 start_codon:yes stop_codon:yes gene_type:complete
MNILTTESNTDKCIQDKDIQIKLHEDYIWIDTKIKRHPIIEKRNKLIKGNSRVKIDTSVLVKYLKKYSIYQAEFEKFAKLSRDSSNLLLRIDLQYKYMTNKVVRKIADSFYNNIEEEFKIDIEQLIPDEWESFTDE